MSNEFNVTHKGVVDGSKIEVHAFIATWKLRPETIAEAKLRGIPEQIDLETIVSTRFHIIGDRLRGKTQQQILDIAEDEAKKLMRIAMFGRLDTQSTQI